MKRFLILIILIGLSGCQPPELGYSATGKLENKEIEKIYNLAVDIKSDFDLNNTAFVKKDQGINDVKVEIGDKNKAEFEPKAKITKWDEVSFSIGVPDKAKLYGQKKAENKTLSLVDDKIEYGDSLMKARFYEIKKDATQNTPTEEDEPFYIGVDYNNADFIKYGPIKARDIAGVHKLPYGEDKVVLSTYWISEDGLGFYGKKKAISNIKNIENLTVPLMRYPTDRDTNCPVSLVRENGIFAVDLFYPNVGEQGDAFLDKFEIAIKEVLSRYGVNVFRRDEKIFTHVLFYEKDGKLYQAGRMTWDNHNVILYMYTLSPLIDKLTENLRNKIILQDKVLFPIGGLSEVNAEIDVSIANEIAEQIALKFNFQLSERTLTGEEEAKKQALIERYNTEQFVLTGEEVAETISRDADALEFDIVLGEKPLTNILEFPIETENLDFFYQPALTEEELDDGGFRPDYVIGSYAVYHKTKKDNFIGGKNYQTGKVFHIYRPKIFDANNNWTWGELRVDTANNVLSVVVPQDFLNGAAYPVIVDPTFGYTTAGGSKSQLNGGTAVNYGSIFTITENGTAGSITAYVDPRTNYTYSRAFAIYESDGDLLAYSNNDTTSWSKDWNSLDLTNGTASLSGSTGYVLFASLMTTNSKDQWDLHYDSGTTNQGYYAAHASGSFDNPETFSNNNNKYSIYATYTTSGGGGSTAGPDTSSVMFFD